LVNILGTINVFKASIDAGVKRIIFASSSHTKVGFKKGIELTKENYEKR
jgi:nucleoside-diphosphate-sugar epimerase